jgi:FtsH-binding integral membrane protein
MKKLILTIGIILFLVGLFQGSRYFLDYDVLTHYGKGYVWGSIIIWLIGLALIIIGLKKKKLEK